MNTDLQQTPTRNEITGGRDNPKESRLYQLNFEEFLDTHFRLKSASFSPRHLINISLPVQPATVAEHWPGTTVCSTHRALDDGRLTLAQAVIEISATCLIHVNSRYRERGSDGIILASTVEEAKSTHELLIRLYGAHGIEIPSETPIFRILALEENHISTHRISLADFPKLGAPEMDLHYGNGFSDWAHKLQQVIENKASSLSILQGPPGTGKTTFLRWLIANSGKEVDFYFLPATCIDLLSNPNMTHFWLRECRNSRLPKVLIVEDAEVLLLKRAAESSQSVANLLNITDGIMGDALRFHIICSINCPFSEIDPALLRSGRLAASWVFRPLEPDQANELASKLGRSFPNSSSPITLADIYASEPCGHMETKKTIGFHPTPTTTK